MFLYKNKIIIPIPTLKPPLFNCVTFIKNLSICDIDKNINNFLENHQHITSQNLDNNQYNILMQEIFKMLCL